MPSISRQYRPQSCSLEITAQTSPLSRWAQRPILKSVHFLLSFRGLSGTNHAPLEIRGNQEQLQLLADTVTQYVQNQLGQSLGTAVTRHTSSLSASGPGSEVHSSSPAQLSLHPRSLVTHDLILGPLSTNADQQTVSLKSSQLFDLVSALEDCTAELETLPVSSPRSRPTLPVWASSAAVIILMLGVSTATFQLTRRQPTLQQDGVISSDPPNANIPPISADTAERDEAEEIAAAPEVQPTTQSQPSPSPSPSSNLPAPPSTPAADSADLDSSAAPQPSSPPVIASAPRPLAPSGPAESAAPPAAPTVSKASEQPQAPAKRQPFSDQKTSQLNRQKPPRQLGRAPVAVTPSPADEPLVRSQAQPSSPPLKTTSPPATESLPATSAGTSVEPTLQGADRLSNHPQRPTLSRNQRQQLGRTAPGMADSAVVAPSTDPSQNIQQYLKQRWQVPANLHQPLRYQLSLHTDGTLKQVKPLNPIATQYLDQVPLPAVNQPFIAPLQSPKPLQFQLILQPDGTIQIFEGVAGNPPPSP